MTPDRAQPCETLKFDPPFGSPKHRQYLVLGPSDEANCATQRRKEFDTPGWQQWAHSGLAYLVDLALLRIGVGLSKSVSLSPDAEVGG